MTEILISSTVLIAAVILLRALFKNRISKRLQYALWLVVALRLALPIQLGTSPISIQRIEPEKLETAITQTAREPISGPSYTVIYSQVAEEYATVGQNIQTPEIRHEIEVETARRITVPTVGEIANMVWAVGAAVMAAWFLFVNLRFRHTLRKNAAEIAVPGCPIPVKICPTLASPCLSGLVYPTVYLTESCTDDPQRLRHILAHELTHLRHGDLIWSALRSILLCVYWFHPLVWVAAILSKRDCELACDEGALTKLGEDQRIAYGKTLLDTVARTPSPNHLLETATSMNETKKQLKERVNFIMKKPKFYLILTVCLLLITAIAIGCTFTDAPEPTDIPPETTEPIETTTPTTVPTESPVFDEYLLRQIELTFSGYYNMRTNWYNAAMLATFDSPQEIDAYDLFEVGTGDPKDRRLTDEELAYLRGTNFVTYMDQGYVPCRMSREYVENVLDQYFGLTTDDIEMEAMYLTYWENTDCYYVISEGHAARAFRLLGAVRQKDGTVLFEHYDPYIIAPKHIYETVIRPADGGYHILSNRIIEKSSLNPDAELAVETRPDTVDLIKKLENLFGNRDSVSPYLSNWYNDALRPNFASAQDLDVHGIFSAAPGIPGYSDLTDGEVEYLKNFPGMMGSLSVDQPIYRIERTYVEEVLNQYFGVQPGEIEIESRLMVYWAETDCYYVASDFGGITELQVLRADVLSDGTIRFQYTDASSGNPEYYEAVIQPVPGGYKILSNLRIANLELVQSTALAPDPRPNPLNLLAWNHLHKDNRFNFALKSAYDDPKDVDLYELLYSMPSIGTLTDEELAFATKHGLNPEISPISRYPVSAIDSILQQVFGISFNECNKVGLDKLVYNPSTDCYYDSHGDFLSGQFTPTDMIQLADGTVKIHYRGCINYDFIPMVVTLIPAEDGYQITSNVPAPTSSAWYPPEESASTSDYPITTSLRWLGSDGQEYSLQQLAGTGLHVLNNAQEILWTIPGTQMPSGIQWLICDGQWAYGIVSNNLLRIELQTGKLESLFTADQMMCGKISNDASKNIMVINGDWLYFLAKVGNRIGLYRMHLPTAQTELLHNEIPGDTLPHTLELLVPWYTQDEISCIYLNPEIQPLVLNTIRNPHSSYRGVFEFDVDSKDEPVSVDLSTVWEIPNLDSTLWYHRQLDFLIIQLQSDHDILAKRLVTYNTQTGTVTETPGWAKPYGDFAPYME